MSGVLEFVDTEGDELTVMQSAEHFMATDVEWDPTGRYVITGQSTHSVVSLFTPSVSINSAMTLTTLFSLKTMESLEN